MKSPTGMIRVMLHGNTFVKVFVITFTLCAIILTACIAFDSTGYGDADYISKIDMTAVIFLMFVYSAVMLFGVGGVYSSRFFYSLPCARKLMTRTVPTIFSGILFAVTVLEMILNIISFSCGIASVQQISDILVLSAICTLVTQLSFVSCWYFAPLIDAILMIGLFSCDGIPALKEFSKHGFGFSVTAAVCIYLAVFAAGYGLSLAIAGGAYRRRSTKRMAAPAALRQM